MLTILILLLLAFGFYTGAKTRLDFTSALFGRLLNFIFCCSYLLQRGRFSFRIVYSISIGYANVKACLLIKRFLLDLDKAFIQRLRFYYCCLQAGWSFVLAIFLHGLTFIPVLKQVNGLLGGVLSVLVLYVGLF